MMNYLVEKCNGFVSFEAFIFEPKVLLLDEVTSALDAVNTAIVEQVIDELHIMG